MYDHDVLNTLSKGIARSRSFFGSSGQGRGEIKSTQLFLIVSSTRG
jgi:hypothetical protein